jgi:pimeloyl-ACP methyl ester carboxylesterase
MSDMRSLLVTLAGLFAVFAAGCNWMLEPIEQRFLFRPWPSDPALLGSVASRDNGIEEIRVKTPDGVTLHGWLKHPTRTPSGERFPLVIVFGGVRRETSWMIDRGDKPDRWGWLFMNYRGYGLSGGEPSERTALEDANLLYDYAAARPDVDASNIVLLGRSLGTYFAVALAKQRPVRGAILATPFDSFAALGAERFPLVANGAAIKRALRFGWHRADHQGARAICPGGERRRHSDGTRRCACARVGWAAAHRDLGGRASLRNRTAPRVLERRGGVPARDRVSVVAP